MRARFILEKFIQDSDPITDMGIGMEYQIDQWIKRQLYTQPHIKNTSKVLNVLIGYHAPDEYIEFILDTRTDYNKNAVLSMCFSYNRYEFIDKLIKLGAKFDNLTQKAFYIIKLDGKLASLTPDEEMKFVCLIGDFKKFVKLVNKGVKVKIGYINSMMKQEYVPYFSINKTGIYAILNYLRNNIDKLDELIHKKDHSKLEKIKHLLNVKRTGKRYEYPRGYKIYRILKFIDENHPKLRKDVVKFIVELTHGVGTFNPLTDASYWSDGFSSIIYPRIDTDEFDDGKSGEFRLNAKGKRDLKEMEAKFGNMNIKSPL